MRKILTSLLFACMAFCPCFGDVAPPAPSPTAESSIESYDAWKSEGHDKEKIEEGAFSAIFARMMVLLLITVTALVVFSWIAKRYLSSRQLMANRTSRIQILERRPLSPKAALLLIRVDEEEFVVAESHAGLNFLKEVKKGT